MPKNGPRWGYERAKIRKIRFYGVSGVDKKAMPTANFKVYYDKKVTKAKKLHGLVKRVSCPLLRMVPLCGGFS